MLRAKRDLSCKCSMLMCPAGFLSCFLFSCLGRPHGGSDRAQIAGASASATPINITITITVNYYRHRRRPPACLFPILGFTQPLICFSAEFLLNFSWPGEGWGCLATHLFFLFFLSFFCTCRLVVAARKDQVAAMKPKRPLPRRPMNRACYISRFGRTR